jgi:hypothetical protein
MATHYDTNSEKLSGSLSTIANDYNFTYFKPPDPRQPSQLNVADLNMCYAGKNDPSVQMTDISLFLNGPTVNHTNDSCKLNAALLQSNRIMSDQQDIYKKTIENGLKKPGLNFNIVNGYYVGNAKYFLGKNLVHQGLATKFDTIQNATNSVITDPTYLKYSVEWYGFFCPSITGIWTFSLSSTNKALLWVGDIAVNDYEATNALCDSELRGTGQTRLNMNRYYPIRIQFGNRTSTDTFSMRINGPTSEDGFPLLNTFYNSDGKLFEKTLTYYSLIENSPQLTSQGLYSCHVTNADVNTYNQLKKRSEGFVQDSIWSLMNETTENDKLEFYNYLGIDATSGIISLYNSSGNVLKSLSDSAGAPIKSTGNLKLSDDGILQVEQIDNAGNAGSYVAVSQSKSGLEAAQTNAKWERYKGANNMTNPYKLTSNISLTAETTPMVLVSNNNKYSLNINNLGNLVINQSINACTTKDSNNVRYTSIDDVNSRYLYRINGDEKMTKLFMENKNLKTILPVDMNSTNISLLNNRYTPYTGYYPADKTGSTIKTRDECQRSCDADKNCSYYYHDSNNSCILNSASSIASDKILPKTFIPKQPTDSADSTLYLRNFGMNLSASDARNGIPRVDTSDYGSYQEHELLIDKSFILNDAKAKKNNIGYNGLDTPLRNQLITNWNYINGKGEPRNQPTIINESFDTRDYQEAKDVRDIGGNPGNNKSLPNEIIDRQINPMLGIAQDYSNLQKKINDKYYSIGDKLNKISNDERSGVRDKLIDDPEEIYDFKGETLYYSSKKPKKVDALKDDVQMMLVQTNDMFILGSLTIASLLIAAIYFGKE